MAKINKELAKVIDSGIIHDGDKIILPAKPKPMTYRKGAECLLEKAQQEEQRVYAHELIEGNPFDALAAFHAVLKLEFGWSTTKGKETFFGTRPPQMVDIKTGPNPEDVIQVPTGVISAPGLDFSFEVMFDQEGLHLLAELPQYQATIVKELGAKVRTYLKNNSIYKGKAFKVPANWSMQPTFVDYSHAKEENLVLNQEVADAVLVKLFGAIRSKDSLKARGIAFRRTVLLSGGYGTGKSMTISILCNIAKEHGITVMLVRPQDVHRLADVIDTARRYMPCIVVAEDIDKVADRRDAKLEPILDVISGSLTSDNDDVMVILTTNHAENMERVMLRRVAMIEFTRPTQDTVARLIQLYGRGTLDVNGGLVAISKKLEGQSPTTIKLVMDNAIEAMVVMGLNRVNEEALIKTVHSMGRQIELLNSKKEEAVPTLDSALRELVKSVAINASLEAFARLHDVRGQKDSAESARSAIN